ncbi:hypothetical protein [Paenibacillus sp. 1001270B_150601_E10]|uniref:hypothetical protein n=1 Tax=Paenibacillus sp. 1001270B_150601_E10 TaxID=2787079 RepID=UPI001E2D3B20|nr:hypothetical protein [Paenibacillus sp. 1001270B_150601_E10]
MVKRHGTAFINLVFFIPAIFLSFMVWRDYNDFLSNDDEHPPSISEIFYLDDGKKMIGLSDVIQGAYSQAYLFDSATGTPLKEIEIRSNVHGMLDAALYQQGGVIIPTYDDSLGLQLNYFQPSGEVEELAQGTLPIPSHLTSGIYSWRGKLIITGERDDSSLYLSQVEDGKLRTSSLNSMDQFPARPVRISELPGSFDNDKAVPMFEIDLKDNRTAYISGLLDHHNQPDLAVKKEEETPFEAQDKAGVQFAKHFGIKDTKLVRADIRYPGQARFYNAAKKEWGGAVPTPKPIYQARVVLLNDQEVLIAGSSTEDELNGSVLGYVLNEQTGSFIDVTELIRILTYDEIKNPQTQFFKEMDSDLLYYSLESESAGTINVKSNVVQTKTTEQVGQWLITVGGDEISLASFWNYVKQGGGLIINWIIWLLLPLLMFGGVGILSFVLRRTQSKQVAEGSILPGTIVHMKETGTYINNQPQVRFTVQFEDEGQTKEVEIKKIISFLNEIRVGDSVVISYDRKKKSAVFVTKENMPEQTGMKIIKAAVLSKIEERGQVNRSRVLQLHFRAGDRNYPVPVLEPPGFEYRIGESATLALTQGAARIYSYGNEVIADDSEQMTMQAEVIRIEEFPIIIANRQLMMLETLLSDQPERLLKSNSLFAPKGIPLKAGIIIPVIMRKEDYEKELRLHKGKQGAAVATSVRYEGTLGERPLAHITVERGGRVYHIHQSIEPLYGVEVGDELWIAYDEASQEAIIINYASV